MPRRSAFPDATHRRPELWADEQAVHLADSPLPERAHRAPEDR